MENLKCPHCGNVLAEGVEVCETCGKEVNADETAPPVPVQKPGGKKIYAIIVVLVVILGGLALLMYSGLLPNPLKDSATAALVNGEKISMADLDQRLTVFKKMSGKSGPMDSMMPAGKEGDMMIKMHVLNTLIQEKILITEAAKNKITVTPQEVTARITEIKQRMNFSDKDFEAFLKNHVLTLAGFEKRMEKDILVSKLIAKGTAETGMTPEVWVDEISKKAKVDIFVK